MAGLIILGLEMVVLFFLNDTPYEPPHKVAFSEYPAVFQLAATVALIPLFFTWIFIVMPLDHMLIRLRIPITSLAFACCLAGFFAGFFLTGSSCSDPLLSIVVGISWGAAGCITAIALKSLQNETEQSGPDNSRPCGTSGISPADSAPRAGDMPEASGSI